MQSELSAPAETPASEESDRGKLHFDKSAESDPSQSGEVEEHHK
jgi:hypothetical protein